MEEAMTQQPDGRFDVLFEPVKIGPVTAPNRFYQVPHCTGMGYALPDTLAAMRAVKAEGGWGVVSTEYCSIHPSSDDMPFPFAALWDDGDVRNLARMAQAVHAHGALAAVELWHGGQRTSNYHSRETAIGPESLPTFYAPWQCRKMDRADIAALRRWHRDAARRARDAGFDIVYVYAGHTYLIAQFLDPATNQRGDDYGGSAENRARLLMELVAETREALGDRCALATRIEVTDEDGTGGEERARLLQQLAPMIDLFDVTVPDYSWEMGTSRFVREASLEAEIAHVRTLTGKPVVSVGRFTSPETMLSQVRRGIVDLVGAARPSIADPFLPAKIRQGRYDDIRECIGCNICYAHDASGVPIRCTQNPTMGEEWRRGWHPERIEPASDRDTVLVVGGGPAGLETAMTLGRRGVRVLLADAEAQMGGRVSLESRLPRLAEWARVRDWRLHQISKLPNVELYPASRMTREDCLATGARHVVVATGSLWRRDGRGRSSPKPVFSSEDARILTPDDLMRGRRGPGPYVVYDDEGYYMAAVLAEMLALEGAEVTVVSSEGRVGQWMENTVEQARTQALLIALGVAIVANSTVEALGAQGARLACIFSGRTQAVPCGSFVPVTSREPRDELWRALQDAGLATLTRVGDCKAPGIIAQAVFDGHRAARMFGQSDEIVRRERVIVA
jgi:dimethylamine/trimethylamine dehydrogenase